MSLHLDVGGAWKTTNNVYANVGNSWKQVKQVYVNVNGVWKPVWTLGAYTTETLKSYSTIPDGNPPKIVSINGSTTLNIDIFGKNKISAYGPFSTVENHTATLTCSLKVGCFIKCVYLTGHPRADEPHYRRSESNYTANGTMRLDLSGAVITNYTSTFNPKLVTITKGDTWIQVYSSGFNIYPQGTPGTLTLSLSTTATSLTITPTLQGRCACSGTINYFKPLF